MSTKNIMHKFRTERIIIDLRSEYEKNITNDMFIVKSNDDLTNLETNNDITKLVILSNNFAEFVKITDIDNILSAFPNLETIILDTNNKFGFGNSFTIDLEKMRRNLPFGRIRYLVACIDFNIENNKKQYSNIKTIIVKCKTEAFVITNFIQRCKDLEKIHVMNDLDNNYFDGLALSISKYTTKLKELIVKSKDLQFDIQCFKFLQKCKDLEVLEIYDSYYVSDECIQIIAMNCPNLKCLKLSQSNIISSNSTGLLEISNSCKQFELLELSCIYDSYLEIFGNFLNLSELHCSFHYYYVTIDKFYIFLEKCKKLKILNIKNFKEWCEFNKINFDDTITKIKEINSDLNVIC